MSRTLVVLLAITGGVAAIAIGLLGYVIGDGILSGTHGQKGGWMMLGGVLAFAGAALVHNREESRVGAWVLVVATVLSAEFLFMPPIQNVILATATVFAFRESS